MNMTLPGIYEIRISTELAASFSILEIFKVVCFYKLLQYVMKKNCRRYLIVNFKLWLGVIYCFISYSIGCLQWRCVIQPKRLSYLLNIKSRLQTHPAKSCMKLTANPPIMWCERDLHRFWKVFTKRDDNDNYSLCIFK